MRNVFVLIGLSVVLAACVTTGRTPGSRDAVPQVVWDRIPASTPIEEIRRGPDGCYWYIRHGPLESLLVPVRDAESVPVCV